MIVKLFRQFVCRCRTKILEKVPAGSTVTPKIEQTLPGVLNSRMLGYEGIKNLLFGWCEKEGLRL
jgi:hypothetical protein